MLYKYKVNLYQIEIILNKKRLELSRRWEDAEIRLQKGGGGEGGKRSRR